jgi:hypothetical protein
MDLIEVNPVRLQPPKACFDGLDDPAARVAASVAALAHLEMRLRCEHDPISPSDQRFADDLLGLAVRVHVRGVDEVDAVLERRIDDANALVVVVVADLAEHHRSKTLNADLDTRAAKRAISQGFSSIACRS